MKRIANALKNRQGMTLIEVVAGMVLFAIIAAAVSVVFVPLMGLYQQANELAESNTLLDNLSDEMLNDLAMASAISVDGDVLVVTTVMGDIRYSVCTDTASENLGALCRAGTVPVLEKQYYKGKSVRLEYFKQDGVTPLDAGAVINPFPVTGPFYIKLTVSSDKDSHDLADRTYAVNPLGLKDYT